MTCPEHDFLYYVRGRLALRTWYLSAGKCRLVTGCHLPGDGEVDVSLLWLPGGTVLQGLQQGEEAGAAVRQPCGHHDHPHAAWREKRDSIPSCKRLQGVGRTHQNKMVGPQVLLTTTTTTKQFKICSMVSSFWRRILLVEQGDKDCSHNV